ncbi:MAG: hypothetical protein ABL996_24110, partial [Micropepsaceae bacterium]
MMPPFPDHVAVRFITEDSDILAADQVGNLAQIVALMTGFGALVLSFMSTNRTGGQKSAA